MFYTDEEFNNIIKQIDDSAAGKTDLAVDDKNKNFTDDQLIELQKHLEKITVPATSLTQHDAVPEFDINGYWKFLKENPSNWVSTQKSPNEILDGETTPVSDEDRKS